MKKGLVSILLLAIVGIAFSQQQQKLDSINAKRIRTNLNGMYVLTGWSVANIAVGTPWALATPESPEKYFHEMNAIWNVVNLGLGVSGILGEKRNGKKTYNTYETVTELNKMQKIYLFNGGLDFAYITTGFCLREWSQNNSQYHNVLLGFGNSLILQGGFLMVFDFAMVALHSSQNPKLKELFSYIRPTPTGVAFCYNF